LHFVFIIMFNLNFLNKNTALLAIAVVGIIVIGVLVFANNSGGNFSFFGIFGSSNNEIAQKAVDYINNNGLSSTPASLVSFSEESGLIKIKIKIGPNEFDSYVTKDGKLLFPQVIDMSQNSEDSGGVSNTQPTEEQKQQAAAAIQKNDNPTLEAYIVSLCPYGVQMQRVMAEVVKTQPLLADYLKVRYMGSIVNGVVTAMHGEAEAKENLRQICIREEQSAKFWNYISCYIKAGNAEGCEKSTGVNSSKLSSCISDPNKGLVYAKKDFDLNDKYDITGSPTLIVNGDSVSEFNFGGRSAEAIKSIICAAFNSQPDFCSAQLNTAQAAASFSENYAASSGSASAANCE